MPSGTLEELLKEGVGVKASDVQQILEKDPDAAFRLIEMNGAPCGIPPIIFALVKDVPDDAIRRIVSRESLSVALPAALGRTGSSILVHVVLLIIQKTLQPTAGNFRVIKHIREAFPEATSAAWSPSDGHRRNILQNLLEYMNEGNCELYSELIKNIACKEAAEWEDHSGMCALHVALINEYASRSQMSGAIHAVACAFPEAAWLPDKSDKLRKTGHCPLYYGMLSVRGGTSQAAHPDVIESVLKACPESQPSTLSELIKMKVAWTTAADVERILAVDEMAAEKPDADGRYPLHLWMENHSAPIDTLKRVLEAYPKAVILRGGGLNMYPIHCGMKNGAPEDYIAAVFSADPSAAFKEDGEGHTALWYTDKSAAHAGAIETVLKDCPHPSTLSELIKMKVAWTTAADVERILAVDEKAAEKPDADGRYPLHLWMENHSAPIDTLKRVLEAYPKAVLLQSGISGMFPLHCGMKNGAPEDYIAAVFGADPSAAFKEDGEGRTALWYGCRTKEQFGDRTLIQPPSVIKTMLYNKGRNASENLGGGNLNPRDLDAYFAFDYTAETSAEEDQRKTLQETFDQLDTDKNGKLSQDEVTAFVMQCAGLNADQYETIAKQTVEKADADGDGNLSFDEFFKLVGGLESISAKLSEEELQNIRGLLESNVFEIGASIHDKSSSAGSGSASQDPPLEPGELHKGWTALQIAAALDRNGPFFWLLDQHKKKTALASFGHPDEATVAAACASHNPKIKKWGKEHGSLCGKNEKGEKYYKILPKAKPIHVSNTCVVICATEMHTGTDGPGEDVEVVLKFMPDEAAFQREIDNRKSVTSDGAQGKDSLLICIRDSYNNITEEDLKPFQERNSIELSSGATPVSAAGHILKYMLVLDKGVTDLSDIISHSNIAGASIHDALSTAVKVAKCLQYINEDCEVMHGDVKSRNFVDKGGGYGYAAIDLDAAAVIKRGSFAGQKVTSCGCLPPEQAAIVLYNRQKKQLEDERKKKAAAKPKQRLSQIEMDQEKTLAELKKKRAQAEDDGREDEVDQISAEIRQLNRAKIAGGSSTLHATAPPPVDASHAYDMWGFGVLLYQLCTGRNLFTMDVREEVDDEELAKIADWSNDPQPKKIKMSRIGDMWPKRLVEQLLSRNPADRPATWSVVIDALEAVSDGGNYRIR